MPSSVYVETSVISYLTARQSQDVIVAARQAITRSWWQETRQRFEVYISMLVVDEAGAGDADAAAQRAQVMAGLPIPELTDGAGACGTTDRARAGAEDERGRLAPYRARHGSRHGFSAEMKARIGAAVEAAGYECPVICSPEELGGEES